MESVKRGINIVFLLICNLIIIFLCAFLILYTFRNKDVKASEVENVKLHEVVNPSSDIDRYMLFKGESSNNYILYNNLIWRIIRVNSSGSMTIILDKPINRLFWNIGSFNLLEYLNNEFINELDLSKLTYNNICTDIVNNLDKPTCENIDNNYVSLLDLNSFIQTIDGDKTFVALDNETIWLENKITDNNAWHTKGSKISYSKTDSLYAVKPVVTLNNDILFEKGNGTKNNPYVVSSNNVTIGSVVKINEDLYEVYSTKDNIKLVSKDKLDSKYMYTGDYLNIIKYLNDEFYETLDYKEKLLNVNWDITYINDGEIAKDSINNKIGLLNLFDLKYDYNDYYLLSFIDNRIIVANETMIYGSKNYSHELRPTVAISKNSELEYQNGIFVMR